MPLHLFIPDATLDPRHAYARKILDGMARGDLPSDPAQYHVIDVKHDLWCALMQGGAWCDCDPTVALEGSQPLARLPDPFRNGR
jgi:hypothetical protein